MVKTLHFASLVLSLWLMASVSFDVFTNTDILTSWWMYITVCILLLADFLLLLTYAPDKRQFLRSYWPLFVVSLPLSLFAALLFEATPLASTELSRASLHYALRFLPLVRGFFSMYIIVGWWVKSVRGRMLLTYLFVSACVVYFSSLLFFDSEHNLNPAVHGYADALWWASMNFTTIGSNIIAASVIGKILGVAMGFCGMMMLPVFTAFFMGAMLGDKRK
jgi:hypothetical protein